MYSAMLRPELVPAQWILRASGGGAMPCQEKKSFRMGLKASWRLGSRHWDRDRAEESKGTRDYKSTQPAHKHSYPVSYGETEYAGVRPRCEKEGLSA